MTKNLSDLLKEDLSLEDLYRILKKEMDKKESVSLIEDVIPKEEVIEASSPDPALEKRIAIALFDLSLSPGYKGYKYLKDALLMLCDEDIDYKTFTKTIYPAIGRKHDTTAQNVEKNIRFAIKKIYESNTPEELERHLGKSALLSNNPSNVKFITYLAEKLRLER